MAAKLWSTFRLKSDASYSTRYKDLMTAFDEAGSNFWSEPTSFLAFDTEYTVDAVTARLKKAINTTSDVVVVREIGADKVRYCGYLEDATTFFEHFPNAKKV